MMKPLTLDRHQTYLVAVSFGPDSMALLHMLITQGYFIHVAHVNYHRRPESNLEQTGLEQFCLQHDIPCSILDVSQTLPQGNFQTEARLVRYRFFKQLMNENHLNALLTGHHEDDHLETALFHEERHSWVPYYGIQYETTLFDMLVIRPLIHNSKQQLLKYCQTYRIPYALDASNFQTVYTRNRIRKTIQTWSAKERSIKLKRITNINTQQAKQIALNKKRYFKGLPLFVFQNTLRELFLIMFAYFEYHQVFTPITQVWLTQLKKIAQSNKPNWTSHVADGLFIKHYDRFEFVRLPSKQPYTMIYKETSIAHPWFDINAHASDKPAWLVRGIKVRNAHPKDRWLRTKHHYKLNRLFGDWKMPSYLRRYWPVFLDRQGNVIYTPRYQKDYVPKKDSWISIHTKRM